MPAPILQIDYQPFTEHDDDLDSSHDDDDSDNDDDNGDDDDDDAIFEDDMSAGVSNDVDVEGASTVSDGHGHSGHVMDIAGTVALAYNAVGVIYGDIGTSPLYAFTAVFQSPPSADDVVGMTSLIVWSLTMSVTFKYVLCVLNADYHGEGGIFAMLALCRNTLRNIVDAQLTTSTAIRISYNRLIRALTIVAFFGCSLLIGDGIITPAISILSSVEGISVAIPSFTPFNVPLTILLLIILFSLQQFGTTKVANLFAPIMMLWFISIGLIGFINIININSSQFYQILSVISPWQWMKYMIRNGSRGYHELAGVILCITGVEALYTDLGHFNLLSIRISWLLFVYPCLILNYLGQASILLIDPTLVDNPFYHSVPILLYWPIVLLSTLATIIASQAMISGAFSLIQAAINLGFFPILNITHTNSLKKGQIYISFINWFICIGSCIIVIYFQSSQALTGAYGMAVCLDMLITSIFFIIILFFVWKFSYYLIFLYIIIFLTIDLCFVGANLIKFNSGGYIPVTFAIILATSMYIWEWGNNNKLLLESNKKNRLLLLETQNNTELKNKIIISDSIIKHDSSGTSDDVITAVNHYKNNNNNNNSNKFNINDLIKIIQQSSAKIRISQTQNTGIFLLNNNNGQEGIPLVVYYLINNIYVFPQTSLFLDINYIDQPYVLDNNNGDNDNNNNNNNNNRSNIDIYSFIVHQQTYKVVYCQVNYGFMEKDQINIHTLISDILNEIDQIMNEKKKENVEQMTSHVTSDDALILTVDDSETKGLTSQNDQEQSTETTFTNISQRLPEHVTYYFSNETLIYNKFVSNLSNRIDSVMIIDSSSLSLTLFWNRILIFLYWIRRFILRFFIFIFNIMSRLSGRSIIYSSLSSTEVVQLGIQIPIDID